MSRRSDDDALAEQPVNESAMLGVGQHPEPGQQAGEEQPERGKVESPLRSRPFDPTGPQRRFFTDSLWGFLLEEEPDGRTRLVVSGCWSLRPRRLQPIMSVLFLELEHRIMQTQQFSNLKRRVESTARTRAAAVHPAAAGASLPLGGLVVDRDGHAPAVVLSRGD